MWTVNFLMFKLVLEKGEELEIKLPTPIGSSKKTREFQKNSYFCFIEYAKAFWLCGSHQTVENSPRDGNTRQLDLPLKKSVCRSRTVRTGHGTTDWFQIRKGVHQGCILSPCLFNLYAEHSTQNVRLDEAQAGIKTAGRNINNLIYADDTILMAERASWWVWKTVKTWLKTEH